MIRIVALPIALGLLAPLAAPSQAEPLVLDSEFRHVRNAEPREWSSYPEKAEAARFHLAFDLESPDSFKLLTLRQEGIKQFWDVLLNGSKLARLTRDHNHLEHGIEIPADLLKATGNELEITTGSDEPDDIRVGDIALHEEIQAFADPERAEQLFEQRGYRRALPPMTATLGLSAVDADTGDPIPCRFTVTDADSGALVFIGAESDDRLAIREGVVYSLDGEATIRLAGDANNPRRYRVHCGRGFEYGLDRGEVVVDDADGASDLRFEIRREVPTPGLVASDPHLHTFQFDRHGDCSLAERLISIAGEGVELPVSTAHDKHIDYSDEAERIGADRWFTSVLGCEVTTGLGHFNSFPIEPGAEPAEHKLRQWPQIFQNIFATPGVQVCILNHGRDVHRGFRPLDPENFDSETGTFREGRELRANAMELVNSGAQQTDPLQLVRDWFALLRSGHRIAGIGSSDSHTTNIAIPGQARTYLEAPDDAPSAIDTDTAVASVLDGRTWISFGLLTRLDPDPQAETVTAKVLGPGWTRTDRLRVYRNGEEVQSIDIPEDEGSRPGEKFARTFTLDDLGAKPGDFLCAVATGPGIAEGWWALKPPYQPTSPDFEPFVMGISPAVWVE
ncbi:MAG: CehA/McbA family metallohydrolase [Verrucomicrobiales bacterium]